MLAKRAIPVPFGTRALSLAGWGWSLGIAALMVLGGANWTLPATRLIAELIGAGLLIAALWGQNRSGQSRLLAADWLLIALTGLFAVHLMPLSPQIWTLLPGREAAALVDREVFGAPRWRPLSLDPEATWRSLLMLVPAAGTYLAVRRGDASRRAALLRGVAIAIAIALVAAFLQFALGADGPLGFYPEGDYDYPVGFFTNRNHQATFLLMALPLFAAWAAGAERAWSSSAVLAGVSVAAGAAVLATASRSGFALLPVSLIATWLAWSERGGHDVRPVAGKRRLMVALGLVGVMVFGFVATLTLGGDDAAGALQRGSVFADQRFMFWPPVVDAAMQFWPLGSGIGTFLDGFQMFEPIEILGPLYLNHAHNDFIEVFLEAGVPGLVLALVGLWEMAVIAAWVWRRREHGQAMLAARMGSIALAVPVLHSLVDYPLRTVALSSLFALGAGLLGGCQRIKPQRKPPKTARILARGPSTRL